jgi:hypothetical protein
MKSEHSSEESSQVSSSVEPSTTEKPDHTETSSSSFSLARAQSRAVFGSKVLVLTVIFIAAIVCGIATYNEVRSRETEEFTTEVSAFFCTTSVRVVPCPVERVQSHIQSLSCNDSLGPLPRRL